MRKEEGQDLVEFALIAPLLFLLLFGIMEFGVAVWRYNTVSVAAREGARAGVPCGASVAQRKAAAEGAATQYAGQVGMIDTDSVGFDVSADVYTMTISVGEMPEPIWAIDVTVNYMHNSITGLFGNIPMRLHSRMLLECLPS